MPRAYVSIGSNLERETWVPRGVTLLGRAFGPLTLSRVHRTRAVGFEGEDFYNLVAGFDTDESPAAVVATLRDIEDRCGRQRAARRFAPRTLDIDLLLYGDLVEQTDDYRLPREELLEYAFMLGPLAEIAPDERHPVDGRRYAELWAAYERPHELLGEVDLALDAPA